MTSLTDRFNRLWTREEAKEDALDSHPDCQYAEVRNGLTAFLTLTYVVELWRTEECYLANDPPKYVEQSYRAR